MKITLCKWTFLCILVFVFLFLVSSSEAAVHSYDVIIVRADLPIDYVIAQAYAHKEGIPIVTTNPQYLEEDVRKQLMGYKSEGATTVLIIGGADTAISYGIEQELKEMGYQVDRLWDWDRIGTAARVAIELWNSSEHAVISNADVSESYLIASSISINLEAPILLTTEDQLPATTVMALEHLEVEKVFLVGPEISSSIEDELKTMGLETQRVGKDIRIWDIPRTKDDELSYTAVGILSGAIVVILMMYALITRGRKLKSIRNEETKKLGRKELRASNGYGTLSFEYDAAGNRTQQIMNGQVITYTYLPHNRLATAGEWTFTYDTNGNTLSKVNPSEEWLFQYNTKDELVQVEHNDEVTGTYLYDGNGHRIQKTEWNQISQQNETIIYIYARGKVCYEKNITTELDALYIYGPTGRIAKKAGDEIVYYHTDHLGSTRLLTDASGNPVTAVGYYPFGKEELTGQKERYLFTGQEKDSTGLYYYKARYLDPETGRFLTQDAWSGDQKKPQSLNKYVYCMNNPLKYTDPSGNQPVDPDYTKYLLEKLESEEEPTSEPEDEFTDWKELGRVLGYAVGGIIGEKFVNEAGVDNLFHHLSTKAKDQLAEKMREEYNLTDEQVEEFKEGFMETVDDGINDWGKKEFDKKFENVEEEVEILFLNIREALASCLWLSGFSFPAGGPKDLFTYLEALKNCYEAGSAFKIAWDYAPSKTEKPKDDAGGGIELVILGLFITIFYKKKRRKKDRRAVYER